MKSYADIYKDGTVTMTTTGKEKKPKPKSLLSRILYKFGYALHKLPPKGLKRKKVKNEG